MSLPTTAVGQRLALDMQGLEALRAAAKQNSPQALKESARQFEALFINMMLKSMREATVSGGLLESQDGQLYTSLLDQQLSQTLSQRGMGLADALLRQLNAQQSPASLQAQAATSATVPQTAPSVLAERALAPLRFPLREGADTVDPDTTALRVAADPVRQFRAAMGTHADEAARMTGLPASFILGQAALESGWGKRQISAADGTPSYNLFGIKSGSGWKGRVVEVATTEYVQGVPQSTVARFRAYDSYADAFRDYANLLLNSPRYERVLSQGQTVTGFAQGLQKAGYATDPAYAAKLTRVIQRALSA
ncbi:MAG: flagellar rod assembly protein/muramidase FlgJ [Pseudomonadota bacterium]